MEGDAWGTPPASGVSGKVLAVDSDNFPLFVGPARRKPQFLHKTWREQCFIIRDLTPLITHPETPV